MSSPDINHGPEAHRERKDSGGWSDDDYDEDGWSLVDSDDPSTAEGADSLDRGWASPIRGEVVDPALHATMSDYADVQVASSPDYRGHDTAGPQSPPSSVHASTQSYAHSPLHAQTQASPPHGSWLLHTHSSPPDQRGRMWVPARVRLGHPPPTPPAFAAPGPLAPESPSREPDPDQQSEAESGTRPAGHVSNPDTAALSRELDASLRRETTRALRRAYRAYMAFVAQPYVAFARDVAGHMGVSVDTLVRRIRTPPPDAPGSLGELASTLRLHSRADASAATVAPYDAQPIADALAAHSASGDPLLTPFCRPAAAAIGAALGSGGDGGGTLRETIGAGGAPYDGGVKREVSDDPAAPEYKQQQQQQQQQDAGGVDAARARRLVARLREIVRAQEEANVRQRRLHRAGRELHEEMRRTHAELVRAIQQTIRLGVARHHTSETRRQFAAELERRPELLGLVVFHELLTSALRIQLHNVRLISGIGDVTLRELMFTARDGIAVQFAAYVAAQANLARFTNHSITRRSGAYYAHRDRAALEHARHLLGLAWRHLRRDPVTRGLYSTFCSTSARGTVPPVGVRLPQPARVPDGPSRTPTGAPILGAAAPDGDAEIGRDDVLDLLDALHPDGRNGLW